MHMNIVDGGDASGHTTLAPIEGLNGYPTQNGVDSGLLNEIAFYR